MKFFKHTMTDFYDGDEIYESETKEDLVEKLIDNMGYRGAPVSEDNYSEEELRRELNESLEEITK